MKSLRALVLLLLALPLLGSDESTGEGGVWILPNFIRVTSSWHHILQQTTSQARSHRQFSDLERDIDMRLPDGMSETLGTCHVPATGQVFGLSVEGGIATIPSRLLKELMNSGVEQAEILLLDRQGRGLAMLLVFDHGEPAVDAYVF